MAKLNKKAELALWWGENKTKVISLAVVVLTFVIILVVFYPFSSEIVIGEVRAVSSPDNNFDALPKATIHNSKIGDIVMTVPVGVILTVGNKVEISRGKTMAGIYRYVFVKKLSSSNESLQNDEPQN